MKQQDYDNEQPGLTINHLIQAAQAGDEASVLAIPCKKVRQLLAQANTNLDDLMLTTSSERIFEVLFLANIQTKNYPTHALRLYHRGLQLKLPIRRMKRLVLLIGCDNGASWPVDVMQGATLFNRPDIAELALPYCTREEIEGSGCAEWLAANGLKTNGSDALIAANQRRNQAEKLLNTANAGDAQHLRQLFQQLGLIYHALDGNEPAGHVLMEAAVRSGSAETQEVVFLHTSVLRTHWRFLSETELQAHEQEKIVSADQSRIPATGKIAAPLMVPVTTASGVDAYLERIKLMDKDVANRLERMVKDSFEIAGFQRELGRAVRPEALDPLKESFPLFTSLIDDIQARASLLWRVEQTTGRPQAMQLPNILIVGKPGWGKTYFIHRLGELLGLPFRALQMSSMSAGFILSGSDPTWSTARPGLIHEALTKGDKANPLFLLDEIDKIGSDSRYPADGPLYQLLEPVHARTFQDECLSYPIDASHINWFASANDLDKAHPAIVSRFDVYEMPEPTPEISRQTAHSVYRESLERSPWATLFDPSPLEKVIEQMANYSPREAHRQLQKAFGRASMAGRSQVSTADFDLPPEAARRKIGFIN